MSYSCVQYHPIMPVKKKAVEEKSEEDGPKELPTCPIDKSLHKAAATGNLGQLKLLNEGTKDAPVEFGSVDLNGA